MQARALLCTAIGTLFWSTGCGAGLVDDLGLDPTDCGADCAPVCGDGACVVGEDCAACPADCTCAASCGDGTCDASEDCGTCPADCTCAPSCDATTTAELTASDGWSNEAMDEAAYGLLTVEVLLRVEAANIDALAAFAAGTVSDWGEAAMTVRFNGDGVLDVRDGDSYTADASVPYAADTWYRVRISADIGARTYTVEVGDCDGVLQTLIADAQFRTGAASSTGLSHLALWSSQTAAIDSAALTWSPGLCEPQTCASLGAECGTPSDGCGGTLASCGTCSGSGTCVDGACCTPTTCAAEGLECGTWDDGCGGSMDCGGCSGGLFCSPAGSCQENDGPQLCEKPTDATVGPRIPLTDHPGGEISGSFVGKRFTSSVKATGPLTLIDCEMPGIKISDGPVVLDHCTVNGWFGVTTDNLDPDLEMLMATHVKVVGPRNNDTMRISTTVSWGHQDEYMNTYFEHSIIHSPCDSQNQANHFDVLQFGGGHNSEFQCVVFSYQADVLGAGTTAYINNGIRNRNVVLEDIWFEGLPVSYVLYGPMTINRCTIERSCARYGYIYPSQEGATLTDCFDDLGDPIQ